MNRGLMAAMRAAALFAAVALPASYARAADDAGIMERVQSAKTAADHEGLAQFYEKQAADATAKAAEHRRMAQTYKGLSGTATGKGYASSAMPEHCEALAKDYDSEAKNFTAMAEAHRQLAKTTK
jgi:hypothetical protein